MRWPIRHQILLPFAGMMLVAVAGVSVLNAFLATRHAEERIDEQVRGVAGTLLDSSFPLTDVVLADMRGLSGAEFVLADERGPIAASRSWAGKFPPIVPVGSVPELRLGPPYEIDGTRYFVAALKMKGPRTSGRGAHSGPLVLHILYPEGHWRASRRGGAGAPPGRGAAPGAGGGGWGRGGGGAWGDFHTVPLPERDDELRDLASGVNQLAEQLDEMRRVIRRTERLALLGQLAGGLAHHLRNDVTGARMAVQLHQRSCRAGDQESLDVALRQLALTEEHLQRFLAAGQPQEPRRVPCEIESIVSQVVRLVEPSCRHRKVDLQVVAGPSSSGTLEADPDQLRHLLMNLVLNAVDATAGGGWVRIESSHDSHGARVRVLDSGPGPPTEFVERLFEPFSTTKPEGVGLGLAVARQVAESHGGTLVYRRLDAATCFELTLPVSSVPQLATRHPQAVIV